VCSNLLQIYALYLYSIAYIVFTDIVQPIVYCVTDIVQPIVYCVTDILRPIVYCVIETTTNSVLCYRYSAAVMSHTSLWEVGSESSNPSKTVLVTGGSGLVGL